MSDTSQPSSAPVLRAHVREIGKLAEVIGALSKEFERQPRVEVLVTLGQRVARLCDEWTQAEAILSGK
jgi:hypothetical protein